MKDAYGGTTVCLSFLSFVYVNYLFVEHQARLSKKVKCKDGLRSEFDVINCSTTLYIHAKF